MARAEMSLADMPEDVLPGGPKARKEQLAALEEFVFQRLSAAQKKPVKKDAKEASPAKGDVPAES